MGFRPLPRSLALPAVFLASLSCLQPGIDPVFLTLLSAAHPVAPADHGWIVGATQTGMATGSLLVWRLGARIPNLAFPLAALCALAAGIATVQVEDTDTLLAVRGVYGLAMGVTYSQAMSNAAVNRPNGAYGAVFLLQLILSTVTALFLPAVSDGLGARMALAALCVVPLGAFALALLAPMGAHSMASGRIVPTAREQRHPTDQAAWAYAGATLLFICATMMVWSFTGALAVTAGITEDVVGQAVAIGSIAGALTAVAVMREQPVVPPPVTGLLAGLSLLSPIAAASSGEPVLFIAAIVLLNIGSTAIIIRGSGLASGRSRDSLFRRFVTTTHSLGMILGPVVGSIASAAMGQTGLLGAAVVAVAGGSALLFLAAKARASRGSWDAAAQTA